MKRLVLLVVVAVATAMFQVDCAGAETNGPGGKVTPVKEDQAIKGKGVAATSMERVLLNPQGFNMEWTCGGKSGHSRVFFLRKDEKILAEIRVIDIDTVDINNPANFGAESCTTFQELRDDGIVFFGCTSASWNIPLAYYPEDKKIPFSGSSVGCPRIALSPW
jgi:hypothetical protein